MGDMILYRSSNAGTGSVIGYPVGNVINFKGNPSDTSITLTWGDPSDIMIGEMSVGWQSTRIVRKVGSKPSSEIDGTIVVESTVRNQYSSVGFKDTGLVEGTTYYYAAFTCSDYGVYSRDPEYIQVTTIHYKVMTVVIDEEDSNPVTCCKYQDDAVGKYYGFNQNAIDEWKDFFRYRPCIMENGNVIQYLDINDYSKQENGNASRIETGIASDRWFTVDNPLWNGNYNMFDDVMVEIPRMGIKLTKTGTKITISMTDEPYADGFSYSAFRFKGKDYSKLYISAYAASKMIGLNSDIHLCSSPYTSLGCGTFDDDITYDHSGGYGIYTGELDSENGKEIIMGYMTNGKKGVDTYHITTWQQWILIQCMTILQTKSLNLEKSYDDSSLTTLDITRTQLTKKSISGGPFWCANQSERGIVTLFGIRDLVAIGSLTGSNDDYPFLNSDAIIYYDGICMTKDGTLYVADDGEYIEDIRDTSSYRNTSVKLMYGLEYPAYITKETVQTDLGFIANAVVGGSSTTHYCDNISWQFWNEYISDKIYFITNGLCRYSGPRNPSSTTIDILGQDGLFVTFPYPGDAGSGSSLEYIYLSRIHISALL